MTAPPVAPGAARPGSRQRGGDRSVAVAASLTLVERNLRAWRGRWLLFGSNFLEAGFFLLSLGLGLGGLVGDIAVPGGAAVPYRVFVGSGMLATTAMFGPVYDTTFNFFVKLKYGRVYDAVLATPLTPTDVARGEVAWAVARGVVYAACFLATMAALGLVRSWWALAAVGAAALTAYGFAGAGLAAATWMRSFLDFDLVHVTLLPLFLLSTVFFPLTRYPGALQRLVAVTPLYQAVVLSRSLVLGQVGWHLVVPAAYLAAMGAAGLAVGARRMAARLQP